MAKRNNPLPDLKFQNISFNDKQKRAYQKWIDQQSRDVSEALYSFTDSNCKISLSQNQGDGSFNFSVTPKQKGSPVTGNVFMFRHAALDKVILIGLYYWSEVLAGGEQFIDPDDDLTW